MSRNLSVSQIGTLKQCAYSWKLSKIDKVPQLTAAWFMHGTACHTAIELWERAGRSKDIVDLFDAAYTEEIAAARKTHPELNMWMRGGRKTTLEDIESRRIKGRKQVSDYAEWAVTQDWRVWTLPDGSPALEVPFWLGVGGEGDIMVGFVDAIWEYPDGTLEVVDYKSGTKYPDSDLQLGVYKVAIREIFGELAETGRYLMLDKLPSKTVDLSGHSMSTVEDEVRHFTDTVRSGVFPADTKSCFTCTVKTSCQFF